MDISKLPVIPQYLGTCWFNAILMSLLYSDGCQETLYNIAIRDGWYLNKKGESFKFLLFTILNLLVKIKRETDEENLIRLYNELEEIYRKNKPEKIFLKYAYKYDYSIRDRLETGYFNDYIITFLKNLGISVLDIIVKDDKIYIGYLTYYKEFVLDPRTTIEKIYNLLISGKIDFITCLDIELIIPHYFEINNIFFKRSIYSINFFDYGIILNSNNYQLRSINISNINKPKHDIAGIIYKTKKYVYNGWLKSTNNPCPLFEFDWIEIKKDFCINTEKCQLPIEYVEGQLCFSFGITKYFIKIYTSPSTIGDEIEVKSFKNLSHISSHIEHYYDDLLNSTDKIKEKIKEFQKYYPDIIPTNLEEMDLEELKKLLKKILDIHFVLEKKEAESISALETTLIEAKEIKQKAIDEIRILKEQAFKDIERMRNEKQFELDEIDKQTRISRHSIRHSKRNLRRANEEKERILLKTDEEKERILLEANEEKERILLEANKEKERILLEASENVNKIIKNAIENAEKNKIQPKKSFWSRFLYKSKVAPQHREV